MSDAIERDAEGRLKGGWKPWTYGVEKDYMEWETLDTRKKKLEEASVWLK